MPQGEIQIHIHIFQYITRYKYRYQPRLKVDKERRCILLMTCFMSQFQYTRRKNLNDKFGFVEVNGT